MGFLFVSQNHQILHSLPIACELSRISDASVIVLTHTPAQAEFARSLARLYPGNRLHYEVLREAKPHPFSAGRKWAKRILLLANRQLLRSLDAIVTPERTSLWLRWAGVTRPRFIHTFHGSSGHDRAHDRRLARFNLLLAPSARRLERIPSLRPDRVAVIGYPKLDLIKRMPPVTRPLFDSVRPTILYNPHHWDHKSSWHVMGQEVLEHFRDRTDFNLIFAPHVRLFDPAERYQENFREFRGYEHLLIDLGSRNSVDMTYARAADIYLGDVSSQVFEFLKFSPRPCVFLNPRRLVWQHQSDFGSWRLGRVVTELRDLDEALATRRQWQSQYQALQTDVVRANFPELGVPAGLRGAVAIQSFLEAGTLRAGWDDLIPPLSDQRDRLCELNTQPATSSAAQMTS